MLTELKAHAKKVLIAEFGAGTSTQKERRASLFPTIQAMLMVKQTEVLEELLKEHIAIAKEIKLIKNQLETLETKDEIIVKPKTKNKK